MNAGSRHIKVPAHTAWLYGCSGINTSLFGIGERTGNTPLEAMVFEYAQLRGDLNGMFHTERYNITINIRSGDILQMTSGADSFLQTITRCVPVTLWAMGSIIRARLFPEACRGSHGSRSGNAPSPASWSS